MHHVNASRVGKRLRDVRTQRGYSQATLERASGIPKARISRYENGHVTPTIESLDALVANMGLTLSEFFRGLT